MILYQDTNSIVKGYIRDEKGIHETREAVEEADVLATSAIAYAEVRAAFARARREARFVDKDEYPAVLRDFQRDWRHYAKVTVASSLIRMAGDLAEEHALRGYDAVYLASALTLRERVPDSITISTWDNELSEAAVREGFSLAYATT